MILLADKYSLIWHLFIKTEIPLWSANYYCPVDTPIPPEVSLFNFSPSAHSLPSKTIIIEVKSWLAQAAFKKKKKWIFLSTDNYLTCTDTGLIWMTTATQKGPLCFFIASIVHTQGKNLHNRIWGLHGNPEIKTFPHDFVLQKHPFTWHVF